MLRATQGRLRSLPVTPLFRRPLPQCGRKGVRSWQGGSRTFTSSTRGTAGEWLRTSGKEFLWRGGRRLAVPTGIALSAYHLAKEAYFEESIEEDERVIQRESEVVTEVVEKAQRITEHSKTSVWAIILSLIRTEFPSVLGSLLSAIFASGLGLALPWSAGQFIDIIREAKDVEELFIPAMTLATLGVLQGVAGCLYYWLVARTGERLAHGLRTELFASIVCQDMEFFDANRTSELMSHMSTDVREIQQAVKHSITIGVRATTSLVGGMASLYLISPQLCLAMGLLVPSMVVVGSVYTRFLRHLSRSASNQLAKANGKAEESVSHVRTVRAFASEEKEAAKFAAAAAKARDLAEQVGLAIGALNGMTIMALNGVGLVVLGLGGMFVVNGEMTTGSLTAFLMQSIKIQQAFSQVSVLLGELVRGSSARARLDDLLQSVPKIPVRGGVVPSNLKGEIEFRHVHFAYPSRPQHQVLTDFSLTIPAGKVTALVGESGAGKSTILGLVERFYDPAAGAVLIDGADIRELDPQRLRKQVAIVSQEPVLFDTSIKENILYSRAHACRDEQEDREDLLGLRMAMEAAKLANCHDFVSKFPQGYLTQVGERGVQLSAGQKQRIAIARAIFASPKILILDEATSALDSESEHLVQEALDNLLEGKTVIVVAHRLSTVRNADNIVVLTKEGIVEQGTHDELMAIGGAYANLISKQLH
mmetsp:Transcript_17707/g.68691  ORF Transcript_17707/g.68691 Transcript_17707/m.68691 type:complete len:705 (+) Transcript_17707:27-2141(+)